MRSPNVSVTPINVEPYPPVSLAGDERLPGRTQIISDPGRSQNDQTAILSNGELFDSSDAEVAQIDFQSAVHMRNKKKRGSMVAEMPRPMSWEGELSDGERDMCIDEDSASQVNHLKQPTKTTH